MCQTIETLSNQPIGKRKCICHISRRTRRSTVRVRGTQWRFFHESTTTDDHMSSCHLSEWTVCDRQQSYGIIYHGLIPFLNRAIGLSFSSNYGAGGYSLSPSITYYPSVDRKVAPAFQLVSLLWKGYNNDAYADAKLGSRGERSAWLASWNHLAQSIYKKIVQLFREGKASPRDVDSRNMSLIHSVIEMVCCFLSSDLRRLMS